MARHGRGNRTTWPVAILLLLAAGVIAYFLFLHNPEGASDDDEAGGGSAANADGRAAGSAGPSDPGGAEPDGDATSAPERRAAARAALEQGLDLREAGKLLEARAKLSEVALSDALPEAEARRAREAAAELADKTLFARRLVADDPYAEAYKVQPGDRLGKIVRDKDLRVPWELLVRLNPNVPDEKRLQPWEAIKLLRGPCHAVVHKGAFAMDLYLQRDELPPVFLRRLEVGLGKDGSTPVGMWRVVAGEKLRRPDYEPEYGTTIPYGQPGYAFGTLGLWMRLEPEDTEKTLPFGRYGIHSTNDPSSIGTEASGGCIRLRDEDMRLVSDLLSGGKSRVEVRP